MSFSSSPPPFFLWFRDEFRDFPRTFIIMDFFYFFETPSILFLGYSVLLPLHLAEMKQKRAVKKNCTAASVINYLNLLSNPNLVISDLFSWSFLFIKYKYWQLFKIMFKRIWSNCIFLFFFFSYICRVFHNFLLILKNHNNN